MDDIRLYRKEQNKKYYIKKRISELSSKYKNLIVLDKKKRSAYRISNFIKRKLIPNIDNEEYINLNEIPSIFIIRLKFTEKNLEIPKDNIDDKKDKKDSIYNEKDKNYQSSKYYNDQMVEALQTSLEEYESNNKLYNYEDVTMNEAILNSLKEDDIDKDLEKALLESLKETKKSKKEIKNINNRCNEKIRLVFGFDLRIVITNPKFPISWGNYIFYFTNDQIEYIKKTWKKINPSTSTGIRFQQRLEYDKGLVKDRNNGR